jgi:hypothetical protein
MLLSSYRLLNGEESIGTLTGMRYNAPEYITLCCNTALESHNADLELERASKCMTATLQECMI